MQVKKTLLLTVPLLIILGCVFSAGCVTDETPARLPEITQMTDYEDFNLYLAEYSGGDYKLDELLAEHITDADLLKKRIAELAAPGYNVTLNLPAKQGCSVFFAEDGVDYLFGRNFDLRDTNCLLVHTEPENGYESFAFAVVGMLNKGANKDPSNAVNALVSPYACMDGMNIKGVAIAVNSVDGPEIYQNRGNPVINAPLAVRLVLDKAASTEEAVKLLDQYDARMIKGYQFFICDESGKTAIVNYINNETVVTWDEKLMTNFYLCDIPENYPAGHGQDRYETAKAQLEAKGYHLNTSESFDILESIQQTPETGGRGLTQWSIVYHPKSGFADIVYHRHWDNPLMFDMGKILPIPYTIAPEAAMA
ncbi:MAG TPA: carcinine hydrolase/isopenicillin-N N-acyltransferase family protein [Methanocorpusculum sp.]|nr:carcinine hydrolase/isopenicillin-N N-acyltransferase family protein [Methanocorpusculum sp.]